MGIFCLYALYTIGVYPIKNIEFLEVMELLKKYASLIISLSISLGIGFLSGVLTMESINEQYTALIKPPFAPPGYIFGIVWPILYVLMGISAYLVYQSHSDEKKQALMVYGIQLILNFFWPILFFNLTMKLMAFLLILTLILLIIIMIRKFYNIKPLAAYLQIPYLLWCIFAAYLNLGIFLLNR